MIGQAILLNRADALATPWRRTIMLLNVADGSILAMSLQSSALINSRNRIPVARTLGFAASFLF